MPGFQYGDNGATYGGPDGSAYGTPLPRQVENLTARAGADSDSEVDLSWNAAGGADEYAIYRAEASGTVVGDYSEIDTTTNTTYTDTGLENGERFYYRVAGRNDVGDGDLSNEADQTTTLPATEISDTDASVRREITLTLNPQDNSPDGEIDIYRSTDGTLGGAVATGLAPDATEYTDTGLLDGEEYFYTARRVTDHAQTDSAQAADTTVLPDEDQPALGNGVLDEVAVDRETAVTNNGDVRYQLRRSEDAPDWETAASFQQFIGAFDTLTFEFVGLLDGEEYEVRGRTETADATGTFTQPVSIVTQFPGFDNFQITNTGATSVTLQWDDVADNEDGTRVQRRAQINGSFAPWDTIDTLSPTSGDSNTVTYTDDAAPSGTTLQYRIQPFTPYTQATSNALETTTGGENAQNVAPEGYHVEVVNPATGRVRVPEVADLQNAPVFDAGPNQQPVVRVPVRKNDVWLSDTYDDDPTMRVWRDGRRLPIEVLRDVEQLEGATVLIGVGGVELEQRVREEYDDDRRHLAVRDLVETETTYGDETPEPGTSTLEDVVQQDADSEAELAAVSSFGADSPVTIDESVVRGRRVAWTTEGELADRDVTGFDNTTNSDEYASGDYWNGTRGPGVSGGPDFAEWDFTPERDIPADDFGVQVRDGSPTAETVQFRWELIEPDDTTHLIDGLTAFIGLVEEPDWTNIGDGAYETQGYGGPDLVAGNTYTLRVKVTDSGGSADQRQYNVDVVAPYDKRAASQLSFPDSVTSGEALGGPAWYVGQNAVFDNAVSAFNVTGGSADITINDTSGAQRLQISNDNGSNWFPSDGSENNTTSVNVDYPTAGSGSRLRVTLDGYEPNGPRNETPRLNYASQELDAYTLRADISQELLLIEETFDNDLASILTAIGEPAERSWGLRTDTNGDIVVRFVQNGQFTADYEPDYSNRTREKLGKTYDSVTVKGSNEPESNIPYTASTTFEALPRENILSGSETVYDDTRNYDRGDDYEINYQAGEIRATAGGDLVVGDTYRIDFRYQARGTFTSPDAPADPDELVTTVPGVTSQRLAEQVAFVLASEVGTPRYAAEVTIPDPDPRFDPTDALPPAALGLPSGIESLEVRGEPQLTEEGLRVRWGTRPPVEATQQRLSRQLGRVSDRS